MTTATPTKKRRQPTEAQRVAAEERRAKMRELAKTVSAMTETERFALIERHGSLVTIEGRSLSPFNSCFLLMQHASVSVVGGFRQWIAAGRCVRKGEHGLAMWIPIAGGKSDEASDDEERKQRFTLATVFDITQTDAAE